MSHNNFFSPSRFLRLLRHDWFIHKKMYLLTLLGLMIGVYTVTYLLIVSHKWNFIEADRYDTSTFLLFIAILVFIGNAFPDLRDQIKTSNYLLLPGSVFEKFMVQFVVRVLLFVPLALGILSAGNHLAKASILADEAIEVHLNFDHFKEEEVIIKNNVVRYYEPIEINFNPSRIPDFNLAETFNKMNFFKGYYYDLASNFWEVMRFILFLFSFAMVLFAGCVYFKGFALVKSLISIVVLLGSFILSLVASQHFFSYPRAKVVYMNLVSINIYFYISLLCCITWLVFLVFTYFKLKEKEV